jgi:histidinol-phosphatase (PHP family)
MLLPRWDGHVHSQFCPHGSHQPTAALLDRAVELGFERVTLVEHAPLPAAVPDPTLDRDNNMAPEHLAPYLAHAVELKRRYAGRLDVRVGLEVDLLPGHDDHLRGLVERHGAVLDEVVCSIHFLPDGSGGWEAVDCSLGSFKRLVVRLGSIAEVRRRYFEVLAEELERDACAPLPRRVGHLLLVDKFRLAFRGAAPDEDALVRQVVAVAAARGYGVDLNSSGLGDQRCGALYLRGVALDEALRLRVPIVFGSDAHAADEVGSGWAEALAELRLAEERCRGTVVGAG